MKGELIDEKVDDNCRFVRKNKIRAETRVRILVTFHHVTLIISNEKFQFQSQSECENLKCLLPALSFQKPLLPFHFIQGKPLIPFHFIQGTKTHHSTSFHSGHVLPISPLLQKPTTTLRSIQGTLNVC